MVKEGAIILDAGTSEKDGAVVGDADPACAAKATIFTPTPGGIGPITVAKVFENLFTLHGLKTKHV
jgi:methylenetetrahydrofolate dehydrogenase (NADP+)/methenyltetrahydrofolate cyclohydrolase